MKNYLTKKKNIDELIEFLKNTKINNSNVSELLLDSLGVTKLSNGYTLYELLKRPEVKMIDIDEYIKDEYSKEVKGIVEIMVKYEGYIAKTNKEVDKMLKLEEKQIPDDIDYNKVINIASEARQKLNLVRPKTIAQASRISGVNPTDISVLSVYLKKEYNKDK